MGDRFNSGGSVDNISSLNKNHGNCLRDGSTGAFSFTFFLIIDSACSIYIGRIRRYCHWVLFTNKRLKGLGVERVFQDVLRIIKAEYMRVRHRMFFYIVPLTALLFVILPILRAYHFAITLHTRSWVGYPGSLPPPGLGEDLSTLLYWFKWGNLPTASGAGLLAGLGIVLFLYVGAVWFGDDLSCGAIKQSAILRVKFRHITWGKVLALMLYTAGTIIFVVAGAVLMTVFLPEVPGRELRSFLHLTLWRNLFLYIAMAFL